MSENIIIYPYNSQVTPLVRHKNLLRGYTITDIVSPKGFYTFGQDAGTIDGGYFVGVSIHDNFDYAINNCDTLLFCEMDNMTQFDYEFHVSKLKLAIQKNKNIICTVKLEKKDYDQVTCMCKENNKYFKYMVAYPDNKDNVYDNINNEHLLQIETPIIFVLGLSERTNKFEIQLLLRNHFINQNYIVSQIGSRSYCELLGFYSFPAFMYNNAVSDYQKVILYNRYVKNIESTEKPDVIIIGIPGGIMPFNNNLTNKFGLAAYEISCALKPDAVVFSTTYEEYYQSYFNIIDDCVQKKFGYEIDCFNIANEKLIPNLLNEKKRMTFTTIEKAIVDQKIKQLGNVGKPIFNVTNKENAKKLFEFIHGSLMNNYTNII